MRRLRVLGILVLVATASPAFGSEVDRVRAHLRKAQDYLAERDLRQLDPRQRALRAERLADLDAYIRRGRFPLNAHIPVVRAPYFVDDAQTHCAMAYLIARSGRADLVERVRSTANNAYVYELAGDDEFAAWLDTNGLTIDEAATIQPTYDPVCTSRSSCVCQRWDGSFGNGVPEAALHVRVDAEGPDPEVTVLGVAGTSTVAVGDRITVAGALALASPGETYVVGRYASETVRPTAYYDNLGSVQDDQLVACPHLNDSTLRLDVDVALDALVAEDCAQRVVAVEPAFEGSYGPDCGCGCTSVRATNGAPLALGFVLLLALRRAAGRAPAPPRSSSRRSDRRARGTPRPARSAGPGHS